MENTSKKRTKRTRSKIFGTLKRPRLAVFRSNRHILAQLINDDMGQTLVFANDAGLKDKKNNDVAKEVGKMVAKKAKEKNIKTAVFDRRYYQYHGKVKDVAEGARQEGLKI